MFKTPASLLERLRQPDDPDAWGRFVQLYTPLLYGWACRRGLQSHDAADLVQEVFLVLSREMPVFHYDPLRSFRAWLHTIFVNKFREKGRRPKLPMVELGDGGLPEVADPGPADLLEENEYRQVLVARALKLIAQQFSPTIQQAFRLFVVDDIPAADVAAQLGISVGTVYSAMSRVLSRLRQELDGLLE